MLRPKQSRFKKYDPVFHLQGKDADSKELSSKIIKQARAKGELNLSKKGLGHVPAKVWRINDLDDEEIRQLDVRLDGDGDKWWEPEPLRLLDLSNNAIKNIPGDIRYLQDSLTSLNLDGNCLERLPTEIGNLHHMTNLSVRGNRLKVLPPGFYKLVELTQLSLADNRLGSLDGDIANLIMLQKLDLSNNLLTELPPSLGFLTRLTELKVSHNLLTEIPPDLGNLRVLTQLILSHNEISQLPPLGELTKMEVLSLSHNRLTSLPQVLGCVALRELYLQNNNIQDLDEDVFEAMSHLKVLDLQHNRIEVVPEQVGQLRHVVQLNLANNAITTLPAVLCHLPHLRSLQVTDNPIQNVRRDIVHCGTQRTLQFLRNSMDRSCEMPIATNELSNPEQTFPDRFSMRGSRSLSLASRGLVSAPDSVFEEAKHAEVVYVDVSNNKLSEPPPGLCVLQDLMTELNLSCNLITTVSPSIAQLGKLQYLDLQRNCLESLPQELATMLRLRELNISFNRFTALPDCVYSLAGLEILLAENNKLTDIDVASLQQLTRLATLDLRNNDISFVPPELGNLKLKSLELSGNSFRTPRHAILEKGTDGVLAYLRDRIQQ